MSHKFLPWQSSKPGFSQDSTALEILNNYSRLHLQEDPIISKSKSTARPSLAYTYEYGGMLVYDIKAKIIDSDTTEERNFDNVSFPIQVINESNLHSYLQAKRITPCPEFMSEYSLPVPSDGITLQFNSKFESGNLKKAIKLSDYEYKLLINADTNSFSQNHWYYFSVTNPRKTAITFNIINMLKFDDLYKSGMQPAVYSTKYYEKTGIKWHRDGSQISYTPTKGFSQDRIYYTLSFTYDFRFASDTVFFAYSIPYTYEKLSHFLHYIKERFPKIVRVNPMCKTVAGNPCEMITITENIKTYMAFEEEVNLWGISSAARKMIKSKKARKNLQAKLLGRDTEEDHGHKAGIIFTARVHSGETVSSFMMNGIIEFLLGETREARILRKKFVFKIVPMLNPDGVRYGNYRCSLIGVDLNRRWGKPNRYLHPTIYYTKKMVEVFAEQHNLLLCCDLHGHSKKRNVFMYGCAVKSMDALTIRKNLMAKVIPFVMNQRSKFFTFKDCHFRLEKSKNSTARVVIYSDFNIAHSYTMEASFFGPLNKKLKSNKYHMNEKDLEEVGKDLCKACLIFTSQAVYMKKLWSTNEFLREIMFNKKKGGSKTERNPEIKMDLASNDEICEGKSGEKVDFNKKSTEKIEEDKEIEKSYQGDHERTEIREGQVQITYKEQRKKKESAETKRNKSEKHAKLDENEGFQEDPGNFKEESSEFNESIDLEGNNSTEFFEPVKLEDEKLWDNIDIVQFSESDQEGSGGSDSCPSEALGDLPTKAVSKRKPKKEKKKTLRALETFPNSEEQPYHSQSTNDQIKEEKPEILKKTYSLRPKFRGTQSRKAQSKEDPVKNSPGLNLSSQHIMFSYPLPYGMPQVTEKTSDNLLRSNQDMIKPKRTFLKFQNGEDLTNVSTNSIPKVSQGLSSSFERNSYRKQERDQSFSIFNKAASNISNFSWTINKPGFIAKNFADSARFRIDKMYSKFSI